MPDTLIICLEPLVLYSILQCQIFRREIIAMESDIEINRVGVLKYSVEDVTILPIESYSESE